jgi:lactococcin 972 family bacteriocin
MRYITLQRGKYVTVALGAALVGALALPATASASASGVGLVGEQASGGSAVITGGEGTRVVVDDTSGDGRLRATQRVGGGVWIYGIGGGNSYSYYDHSGKTHKSTACAGFGTSCRSSGWVAKGTRSVAQVLRTAGGNTAFWDTK